VACWSANGVTVAESDITVVFEHHGRACFPATTVLRTTEAGIATCRLLLYPEPSLARLAERPPAPVHCTAPRSASRPRSVA
jgi:hypothetical protein